MVDEKPKTPFQKRFDAVMAHFGVRKRTALARALGLEGAQMSQVLYNWYERDQRIPDKERQRFASHGLSIDWINDGIGDLKLQTVTGAELADAIAAMDRPDPATLARVHLFMAGNGEYNLADPYYSEIFADAYEWIKSKMKAGDDGADNSLDFARWCKQKAGDDTPLSDAEIIRNLEQFTQSMREKHEEFHMLTEAKSAPPARSGINRKIG